MDKVELGQTGLSVSVAGLGCGGSSRLGLGYGKDEAHAAEIVKLAFELGVNFFDTAQVYGTESAVGRALRDLPRDEVVVATKSQIAKDGELWNAPRVLANLEQSLRRLGLDYIDVFMLHAVRPEHYEHALNLRHALGTALDAGKIRHIGITETGPFDPGHLMLSRAVEDPEWRVVMLAFHMMHQNARRLIFPKTKRNCIGTLGMFAVRAIFSRPARLRQAVDDLVANGELSSGFSASDKPLEFLVKEFGTDSLIDMAYRYARHEPGIDVVLCGTGDAEHLRRNIASITAPPLPEGAAERLHSLFGHLTGVGLDLPSPSKS